MIVRMKKITLLVTERNRRELITKLRRLGTVHIRNISKPSGEEVNNAGSVITQAENAISVLHQVNMRKFHGTFKYRMDEVPEKVKAIVEASGKREDLRRELQDVESQIKRFKPWGIFKPADIRELEKKGLFIRFYCITKGGLRTIKARKDVQLISRDGQYAYIVQVSQDPEEKLPFEETKLPKEGLEVINSQQWLIQKKIDEIGVFLKNEAKAMGCYRRYLAQLKGRDTFLNVLYGMKKEAAFSYVQGFCPMGKADEIIDLAKAAGGAHLIEDPDDSESPPTYIKNPRWIQIINPVFKFMNVVPGYKEQDISVWFLIFFSMFFAMLIGDAGYGTLFALLTFFAQTKMKKVSGSVFALMYVFSGATILWGAITGTWFGIEKLTQVPFFNAMIVPNVNSYIETNQKFLMFICFTIGVVHLSIAHLVNVFKRINSLVALGETGWIFVLWSLYFVILSLSVDKPLPGFVMYLLGAGVFLILFFSNPQKNILKGALMTGMFLPLKIISSFGDIFSYIRLFAVGYASVALAGVFNNLALDVGFSNIITGLGAAIILFLGHALNITLGMMAVLVHGIRLNMLEFSGQMGLEWAGEEYNPFKEQEVTS